jgi:hypothetical protein
VKKDVDLSRRNFLLGGALLGGAIVGGIGTIIKPGTVYAALPSYLPHPPAGAVDVNLVKKLAYNYYFTAGG